MEGSVGADQLFSDALREMEKESSQHFIAHLTSNPPTDHSTSLLTPQSFQTRYSPFLLPSKTKANKKLGLSLGDCRALLRYLERDKGVIVADDKGEVSLNPCEEMLYDDPWLMLGS